MTADERKLLTAFRAGDRAAFDTLYQQYARRVFAFARQLTLNGADAEDLTQETFVAAFRGRAGFRGGSSLLTWLLGIALRRWRDRRRNLPPPSVDLPEATGDDGFADRTVAFIAYEQALGELPHDLREAFLLVAVQGLTHREAAELLERPLGTVKWRVAEAVRRLRAVLSETEEGEQEPDHVPARTR